MERDRDEKGVYTKVYGESDVKRIRNLFLEGVSITAIATETGCSKTQVWRLCRDIERPRAKKAYVETGIRNEYCINGNGTVSIQLTYKGDKLETIISEFDFDKVKSFSTKWYAQYSKNNNSFYAMCKNKNSPHIQLHRFIMSPPDDMLVDHRNHDTLDNRRENLKIVTHSGNQQNRKKQGTGVAWYKPYSKWRARFRKDGKTYHVGYFDDKEEAENAVKEKKEALKF